MDSRTGKVLVTILAVLAACLITPSTPAVAAAGDAGLVGLVVGGGPDVTGLSHPFTPDTHAYQVLANDSATSLTVSPTPADAGAAVVVTVDGRAVPLFGGTATVPLDRGRTAVTVAVTSADGTATEEYRVTAWRNAAPTPTIVALNDTVSTVYGGTRVSVVLANGDLPPGCDIYSPAGGNINPYVSVSFEPTTGLTTAVFELHRADDRAATTADLTVGVACALPNSPDRVTATIGRKDAITYLPGFPVDSIDIPSRVSAGSVFTLRGRALSSNAAVSYWMTDAQGRIPADETWTWGWTGNGNDQVALGFPWGDQIEWFSQAGPKTLYVGDCPTSQITAACTVLYRRTGIEFVPPVPTDVTFTPAAGPVTGGTTVRLRGRFLLSGMVNDLVIKVGDQVVPTYTKVSAATDSDQFDEYTTGYDVVQFTVPPAVAAGPVPITVTNDIGTTVTPATFGYGAKPTITGISPGTVAASGGSVITVTGTNFGTSGTPTVVVGGTKSPRVTRVSATSLTAVVPSGSVGRADVAVVSAQGGGASAPAPLTLTAPGTGPTVGAVTPNSGKPGATVTITGTGFGAAGTVGVSIGGQWAAVSASTGTSITAEVPPGAATGAQDVQVGAVTGTAVRAGAFTVLPPDGITAVTPPTIPSYATGAATAVTLTGAGFGTTGTVKVGSATGVAYTATGGGTVISGVRVPTTTAGTLPILVTPTGASGPLRAVVTVTGPAISYLGSDPPNAMYGPPDPNRAPGNGGLALSASTAGGTKVRIEGSGFGPAGTVTVGGTQVPTTAWNDATVAFTAPPHAAGSVTVTLTPTGSTLTASRANGLTYVTPPPAAPTFVAVSSAVDAGHGARNRFDPRADLSDTFVLTGTDLAGSDPTRTRVRVADYYGGVDVVPTNVTGTSLEFAAPRGFADSGYKVLTVTTDLGSFSQEAALEYLADGIAVTASPVNGPCVRADLPATGSVTHQPSVITIEASDTGAFGPSGTVTLDGVVVTPTSWTDTRVVVSTADLATDLTDPWGAVTIELDPDAGYLPTQRVGFRCAVTPTVTTTANGATALTVPVGTAVTMGYTTRGIVGTFTASAPGGYEYVTAAEYQSHGFSSTVRAGVPTAAGEYYVRVATTRATYPADRYLSFSVAPVHLTLTGTPITITPVSDNGSTFVYKGQLGDGTGGTPTDLHWTATAAADPITGVTWEYRDSVCAAQGAAAGWTDGLPKDVARSSTACGGDGSTVSRWEVRIKAVTMDAGGTDRSVFYQATRPTVQLEITPRPLTVTALRADKVYDGTTAAPLRGLTVSGAVAGDDIGLANAATAGTFADPAVGENKPVTFAADLGLAAAAGRNYTLTDPRPATVGTIAKAPVVLGLTASPPSVVLSRNTPVTVAATATDPRTGQPVTGAAAIALTSSTPDVCTLAGGTVAFAAAGTCTVTATQPASANQLAPTPATVQIAAYADPQPLTVVADDLTVVTGGPVVPTSQVSGLVGGDTLTGVGYRFYAGGTLLPATPSAPGRYRIEPTGGTLTAADTGAYTNPSSFGYVAGTLTITVPPQPTVPDPDPDPPAPPVTATAPTGLSVTGQDQRIRVTFHPPAAGGPFTGYQTTVDGGRSWRAVRPVGVGGGAIGFTVPAANGVTYSAGVRALNVLGPGRASALVRVVPNAAPLGSVKPRNAREVAIPANPKAYRGPLAWTKAKDTARNGVWAHPANRIGTRQLTRNEAVTFGGDALFRPGTATLTAAGRAQLRGFAGHLRLARTVRCEVYGDYAGDPRREATLTAQRARAVCATLVAYGARVRTGPTGYGIARPAIVGGTPQHRAANRRVVVLVTS